MKEVFKKGIKHMSITEYAKARKKAQRNYRAQLLKGTYPYLQALDDIVSFAEISSETELGLVEIPLNAIVGTRTAGRKQAFASNFMPLLVKTVNLPVNGQLFIMPILKKESAIRLKPSNL